MPFLSLKLCSKSLRNCGLHSFLSSLVKMCVFLPLLLGDFFFFLPPVGLNVRFLTLGSYLVESFPLPFLLC